jgi:hypothetical protein
VNTSFYKILRLKIFVRNYGLRVGSVKGYAIAGEIRKSIYAMREIVVSFCPHEHIKR